MGPVLIGSLGGQSLLLKELGFFIAGGGGFLIVSQDNGACFNRISWRAKPTSEGVRFFYCRRRGGKFRALSGCASFHPKTANFTIIDFIVSALTIYYKMCSC